MIVMHGISLIMLCRQLTYPGVPATLPNEVGGLTTLQTLEVIGGSSIPGKVLFLSDLPYS